VVPSDYSVSTQLEFWLFCFWGCGCFWAVTIHTERDPKISPKNSFLQRSPILLIKFTPNFAHNLSNISKEKNLGFTN